jgi:hypothetical protein
MRANPGEPKQQSLTSFEQMVAHCFDSQLPHYYATVRVYGPAHPLWNLFRDVHVAALSFLLRPAANGSKSLKGRRVWARTRKA